ncbi:uncharacterized protein LOC116151677 isoform X4 [Camelus dromedarius]|uniref:uncharacterized protein LOC116151677 isoform X4 n=1 Tax=Camelus dromedarius TaxID=9838 RepID=UPI00311A1071
MAGRLGSAAAGGPEPHSLPPLLTGTASRPGDSGGCPRGAGGRHGDPGKAFEGPRVPQVLTATSAAASAPSAGTAASAATAARPAMAQEPLHRWLETEKNYHFCQLGCRKIWTSGFHKWAELCHNGNSAAESAVIYPMWPSAEAITLSELTVHPFFSSWYIN